MPPFQTRRKLLGPLSSVSLWITSIRSMSSTASRPLGQAAVETGMNAWHSCAGTTDDRRRACPRAMRCAMDRMLRKFPRQQQKLCLRQRLLALAVPSVTRWVRIDPVTSAASSCIARGIARSFTGRSTSANAQSSPWKRCRPCKRCLFHGLRRAACAIQWIALNRSLIWRP